MFANNNKEITLFPCNAADDAKLNCKKMRESRQAAAGLSRKDIALSRRPRSFCYNDNEAVNFIVTFLGVLITLLLLGSCLEHFMFIESFIPY